MSHEGWQARAEVAAALARQVEDPTVHAALLELLLDSEDTAVTARTAEALLAQRHPAAFRLLVVAGAAGHDGHRDWIAGAIEDLAAAEPAEESRLREWLAHMQGGGGEDAEAAHVWAAWFGW